MAEKSDHAFRTIGELAAELGVPQHILRYWETRFTQLKPLQRAGNRRYYRPDDVALARRIHRLLNEEGYTIRGVQRVLGEKADDDSGTQTGAPAPRTVASASTATDVRPATNAVEMTMLRAVRSRLAAALAESA